MPRRSEPRARGEEEALAEEMHRERMKRTMRIPTRGDTIQKRVTRICVEASEEELELMLRGASTEPEEIISWALAAAESRISSRRVKWRAFWSLQPPL